MNSVQIHGLILNLIVYLIMIFPIIILSFKKSIYKSKKDLVFFVLISIFIESFFSFLIYSFGKNIFSFFTATTGVINYAYYASRILFITSSLFGIKILIPAYLNIVQGTKKTVTLILLKITVNIILCFIGYICFNTKGFLYAFPVCEFIFYIIYILKVVR